MRYHPPAFSLLPKVVPPAGDTLGGKFVPGGTKIAINPWGMMRNTSTFGEDVYVFRPERWREATPDKRVEMERTVEQIFGMGRYMCAGKTVAFIELNKVFVEVGHSLARCPHLLSKLKTLTKTHPSSSTDSFFESFTSRLSILRILGPSHRMSCSSFMTCGCGLR